MARQNVELANVDVERLLRQIIYERPEVQNPRRLEIVKSFVAGARPRGVVDQVINNLSTTPWP
jgi:hypothetical protein